MMAPRLRILVTGASGFVGRCLLPVLREAYPAARLIAASRAATPQTTASHTAVLPNAAIPDADEIVSLDL